VLRFVVPAVLRFAAPEAPRRGLGALPPAPARAPDPVRPGALRRRSGAGVFLDTP